MAISQKLSQLFIMLSLIACSCTQYKPSGSEAGLPNVVLIYADDLGIGDVSCYNQNSKIPTPHIDRLASEGILFTNAHSPATICSPSRYAILTGQYHWRTDRRSNPKPGEQTWLQVDRITLAKMLREKGYDAAAIGKWGLAADWNAIANPGREGFDISPEAVDYSKPLPIAKPFGFNYDHLHLWFGTSYFTRYYSWDADSNYVDGGRWNFENGISKGGGPPDFQDFNMREEQVFFMNKAVEYINVKGGNAKNENMTHTQGQPFFLYYAPHIPHGPVVSAEQFQGKTKAGDYGDFVYELDHAVGQIVQALKQNGFYENTLIVFTSDNGPENWAYDRIKQFNHVSMGPYRGTKRDTWEAGHRVPFVVAWPSKFQKGIVTDQLTCQTDILATLAEVINYKIADGQDKDSKSFYQSCLGNADKGHRESISMKPMGYRKEIGYTSITTRVNQFRLKNPNGSKKKEVYIKWIPAKTYCII